MHRDQALERLAAHEAQGLTRRRFTRQTPTGVWFDDGQQRFLSFCSNDYLGLASDPRLVERAKAALDRWGFGSGASHYVSGHTQAHADLEQRLADLTRRDAAILFPSGYMANIACLCVLAGRGDTIIQDKLNHASLIDGARTSGARLLRYPHGDLDALRRQLQQAGGRRVVAVDGVFSMDGDRADLQALAALCEEFEATLIVDDAHGVGVLGPEGAGSTLEAGLGQDQVPVLMGTLGKAFGGYGAFVAGPAHLIELLVQFARTAIYTTASPPAWAEAMCLAVDIARTESFRRDHLHQLIAHFRRGMSREGWQLMASDTPIQPVWVGKTEEASRLSDALATQGLWVPAIRPPTVPEASSRLRVTLSAEHSLEQLDILLAAFRHIRAEA